MAYVAWSVVFGEQPSAAKWNILGTNDASFNDGTGIAASAITPEKLLTGTGTSWAWQSWTPTYNGLTIGNGTVVAKYNQTGKLVVGFFDFILGTTSAVATPAQFSAPVTASGNYTAASNVIGLARYAVAGTNYIAFCRLETTTSIRPLVVAAGGTYATELGVTNLIPGTWTTANRMFCSFQYEAA